MKINPIIIAAALVLASCGKPELPDPTISLQPPPAQLMEPSEELETIPLPEENASEPEISTR